VPKEEPPRPGDDATFTANFLALDDCDGGGAGTAACDVTGVATPLSGPHSGKQNIGGGGVNRPKITLTFSNFLQTSNGEYTGDEGKSCFRTGNYDNVILDIHKKTPNSDEARISLWFTAKDKGDADTDVTYSLSLSGDFVDVTKWAPEGEETAMTHGFPGTFMVGSNNSPASLACKGTGSVNFSVEVERID